jgi:hypothetical protein
MIAQTSAAQLDPNTQSLDIPQKSNEPIVADTATTATVSKSKWDDDDDEMSTDSIQQNETQSES